VTPGPLASPKVRPGTYFFFVKFRFEVLFLEKNNLKKYKKWKKIPIAFRPPTGLRWAFSL
jgi:hypothetical protein